MPIAMVHYEKRAGRMRAIGNSDRFENAVRQLVIGGFGAFEQRDSIPRSFTGNKTHECPWIKMSLRLFACAFDEPVAGDFQIFFLTLSIIFMISSFAQL